MSGVESDKLDAMSKYLIYGLVDPRTLMVRYVGKSANGMKRPKMHKRESGHNQHKDRWIAQMRAEGLDFEIVMLQESSAETLSSDERWWIAYGRAIAWPLTNLTDGGEGGVTFAGRKHSVEARAKMSAARLGTKLSDETRNKISAVHKGRKHSDDHRRKRSEALKGVMPSDECMAASRAANTGRVKSADEILKMKEIGRRESNLKHLARVSASNRGRKHSTETIEKMKAVWRRRRAVLSESAS